MGARDIRTSFYERARTVSPFLVADTTFGQFIVPSQGGDLGRALFVDREQHPDLLALRCAVRLLQRHRRSKWPAGLHMVDVGAGLGLRSVPALARYGFEQVVACEPDAQLARLLRMNARLNDCHSRIRVAPLSVCADRPATSGRDSEIVTLDRLAERGLYDPSSVGLVWIGASEPVLAVLAGARSLIARAVPIVVEVVPALGQRAECEALVTALDGRYRHATIVGRRVGRVRRLKSLTTTEPDGSHLLLTSFD